ncbi:vesicle-associated membrane protein 8, partial [Opisthocomus hoazin]|uniref:vesicle-associated membrane protein 8 n=1 Tax=Opisthocomus hoazin TaxID=30419 RepID=UPI003F5352C5
PRGAADPGSPGRGRGGSGAERGRPWRAARRAGDVAGGDVAGGDVAGAGRVRALQREIEGVKSIMSQNVERVLARGENLEQLHSKSRDLEATSERFQTTSQKVARRYWWQNVKLLLILGLVGAIVLILIILLATGAIPT